MEEEGEGEGGDNEKRKKCPSHIVGNIQNLEEVEKNAAKAKEKHILYALPHSIRHFKERLTIYTPTGIRTMGASMKCAFELLNVNDPSTKRISKAICAITKRAVYDESISSNLKHREGNHWYWFGSAELLAYHLFQYRIVPLPLLTFPATNER